MALCPSCSKSISISEDNFGTLFRCEHCQSEFFIGFDGVPENSKEPVVTDDLVPTNPSLDSSLMPSLEMTGFNSLPELNPSGDLFNIASSSPDSASEAMSGVNASGFSETSLASDTGALHATEVDAEMNSPGFQSNMGQAQVTEVEHNMSSAFQTFAQDVQDFGNDTAMNGVLSFDIEISGIDLGDLKVDLIEALDDRRFGWSAEELTQKIADGKLTIENISAPKMIVLVKRITPMGLTLNWRHRVSTQ